jgi:hypothetical protein
MYHRSKDAQVGRTWLQSGDLGSVAQLGSQPFLLFAYLCGVSQFKSIIYIYILLIDIYIYLYISIYVIMYI